MNLLLSLTVEVAGNTAKLNVLERQTSKTPEIIAHMQFLNNLIIGDRKTITRLENEAEARFEQTYMDAMNH